MAPGTWRFTRGAKASCASGSAKASVPPAPGWPKHPGPVAEGCLRRGAHEAQPEGRLPLQHRIKSLAPRCQGRLPALPQARGIREKARIGSARPGRAMKIHRGQHGLLKGRKPRTASGRLRTPKARAARDPGVARALRKSASTPGGKRWGAPGTRLTQRARCCSLSPKTSSSPWAAA